MANNYKTNGTRSIRIRSFFQSFNPLARQAAYFYLPVILLLVLFGTQASAQVPVSYFAVFYQNLMEFSGTGNLVINGLVQCNSNIYVGAGGEVTLAFSNTVAAAGTISAPANNGASWGNPTNFNSSWNTFFYGSPAFITNARVMNLVLDGNNPHAIIDLPAPGENPNVPPGLGRLFNQAQVVILVSNTSVTTIIQAAPGAGQLSADDPSPVVFTVSSNLASSLPFLTFTNVFRDQREGKFTLTDQIDVGQYATWLSTNDNIAGKFPPGSGRYPTLLYVADNRTVATNQLAVVRLTNGIAPPPNGGLGFSVATPNPLYVWGNYNCSNAIFLGTTNTFATVPCAFFSDALTILSPRWTDTNSLLTAYSNNSAAWDAASNVTINAAILTGIVPSTGTDSQHFSGGVQNLPRLLENWTGCSLYLNTSLVNLYSSTRATNLFQAPGIYYNPPVRKYSHDPRFDDPTVAPPGMPLVGLGSYPLIVVQPQSGTVPTGNSVTLVAAAMGYGSLGYQWNFNGTNLSGATNASLALTNLQISQTGNYTLTVTDAFGTNTSSAAVLTVIDLPAAISLQPTNQTRVVGASVTFTIAAIGSWPLNYQWNFNGTNLYGATNASLTLTNLQASQSGTYFVLVSNEFGSVTSSNALLTVPPCTLDMISWWRAEGDATDSAGTNNGASGRGGTIDYAPGKIGQAFAFAGKGVSIPDSPDFELTNSMTLEGWVYASNYTGIISIRADLLSISWEMNMYTPGYVMFMIAASTNEFVQLFAPVSLNQWQHIVATLDGTTGDLNLYVNGALLAQTNTSLRPVGVLQTGLDPGIGIGNVQSSFWSSPFYGLIDELSLYSRALSALEIQTIYDAAATGGKCYDPVPPSVLAQPANQAALIGSTVSFAATAAGTAPLNWQWQLNGTNIVAATNATLILTNVGILQAGAYSVIVTNGVGSTTSSNAALSVYSSATPTIASFSLSPDNQFQFTIVGVPGLTYTLLSSTNLIDWISIVTNTSPFTFTDANTADNPQLFYRAVYLP